MRQCLVVDDSSVIRKVARKILEGLQFEVIEAENGQEALERCSAATPDAILLDWHMPVMGGMEFLNALKFSPSSDKKPYVVYATTENDSVDLTKALSNGADDYILKPFDRNTLEAKMIAGGFT